MLQTWRLNSKNENETHQQQVFDPETAKPVVQQACNSCRIKKLRCSGEKSGCARCQNLLQSCVYARNGARRKSKSKDSTSKIDDDAHSSSRPASISLTTSIPTSTTETWPSSSRPGPSTSVSNAPNAELYVASVQPGNNATNPASFEFDTMPFEPQDYWSIQGVSTAQMTGQGADTWPLSWSDSAQENHLTPAKVPWEGDTMNPSAVPLSLPSVERWDYNIMGHNEMPPTPTSRQAAFSSDIHATGLSPGSQVIAGGRHWPHSQTREPCQCVQLVTFILEELDCGSVDTNSMELGPWLLRHKEALRYGKALLSCPLCHTKPEHIAVLTFLTDRLIAISEGVRQRADLTQRRIVVLLQKFQSTRNGLVISVFPPVLIFASAERRTVNFHSPNPIISLMPSRQEFRDGIPRGGHSTIADLYSESVERFAIDNAEGGSHLVLPFSFRGSGQENGAIASDGGLVAEASVADLLQHRFKPFGGEW
ncbi:hypothetical protein HD806DRAFT_543399 [Xylariaceae sp. AK1471]|nr:hypothetical protein HD806DRAFT_543399 [Xylariaceae sp. AK1471]